jgi:uncharacterized membrane protein
LFIAGIQIAVGVFLMLFGFRLWKLTAGISGTEEKERRERNKKKEKQKKKNKKKKMISDFSIDRISGWILFRVLFRAVLLAHLSQHCVYR